MSLPCLHFLERFHPPSKCIEAQISRRATRKPNERTPNNQHQPKVWRSADQAEIKTCSALLASTCSWLPVAKRERQQSSGDMEPSFVWKMLCACPKKRSVRRLRCMQREGSFFFSPTAHQYNAPYLHQRNQKMKLTSTTTATNKVHRDLCLEPPAYAS